MQIKAGSDPSRPPLATTNGIEGAALSTSLLCLAHCTALPLLILLLPSAAEAFVRSEAFHFAAVGLVIPFALLAFRLGYLHHGARRPAAFGAAGGFLLLLALAPGLPEQASLAVTFAGSLLLIAGHWINWQLRRHAT